MQDQKLPVNHQSSIVFPSNQHNFSASSGTKLKKSKSLTILGLIASISSLGVSISSQKPAAAKTTIFDDRGETLITKLPSLETSTTTVNQTQFPTSKLLTNSSLDRSSIEEEIARIPSLVAQITKKETTKNIYTVKQGDTISGIARQYGVSSSQIIQANKLSNPNFIKINHQLVIPNIELAQENNYQRINTSTKEREFSISNSAVVSQNQKPPSLSSIAEQKAESRTKKRREIVVETNSSESQLANNRMTVKDPYISKLRQDIVNLRTQYQQQNGDSETTANNSSNSIPALNIPQSSATSLVETGASNTTATEPKTQAMTEDASSVLRGRSRPKGAPISRENFNSLISLSRTNTITPDLPPLASPEEYLPDNPIFDGYMWPAKGTLTSGYGWRWGRMHKGIDIAAPIGTPIMAAASGEVIFAGWSSGGYGNLVKLRHQDGSVTFYAHNNRVMVRNGQKVRQGELIAEMGSTGRSTGPHLHFEIRPNGSTAINPMARLPKTN